MSLDGADEHVQDDSEVADLVNLGGDDESAESNDVDIELEEQTDGDDSVGGESASLDNTEVDTTTSDFFSESGSTTASLSSRSATELSISDDDKDELPVADEDDSDDDEELNVQVDETVAKPREANIVRALAQFDWNGKSRLILDDSDSNDISDDDDCDEDDEHESNDDDEGDGIVLAPRGMLRHNAEPKTLAKQSSSATSSAGSELMEIPLAATPSVLSHS